MTARECREAVAEALRVNVLPAGWTVYAAPPTAVSAPCVMVEPRNPYRVMETFTEERVGLRVTVLMAPTAGMDAMDAILDVLVPALWEVDTVGIDQVTDVGGTTEASTGQTYLSASIDLWVI